MSSVVLESPRLLLRRLEPRDSGAVFAYRSAPRVYEYQLWVPENEQEVREFIHHKIAALPNTKGTWFQFAVCLRDGGELIGDCGIRFPEDDEEQVEIGITLSPAHQSRGYAAEALESLLQYVFGTLGKHRVFASVDPENRACIKLLERVGMRREAHHIESLRFRGRWVDDLIFALLSREWHEGT